MLRPSIMIMGTSSGAGKSLIATALCRIFYQDGYDVAPFKAQNMSNNSFVTKDGLEIGRAQAVQAFAACLEPSVHMNPVLLKPTSPSGSQVVIHGKATGVIDAENYKETKEILRKSIVASYNHMCSSHKLMVIEGAGSPAEINLKKHDIVNFGMAKKADASVFLVGDIDRGGVFASLIGTMLLLTREERKRVKGFIINKFYGDVESLKPGLVQLEKLTGVPVLGVIPHIEHSIDDEDCVTDRLSVVSKRYEVDICIIKLPHIANLTDFTAFDSIPGVSVRYADSPEKIGVPDMLIIPGTKATIADLRAIKECKIADEILQYVKNGGIVFGICGGFQILGKMIADCEGIESSIREESGLALLDMKTEFKKEKVTEQVSGLINDSGLYLLNNTGNQSVEGYEIHHGQSVFNPSSIVFTSRKTKNGMTVTNGISSLDGNVFGTYIHGVFDNNNFTVPFINNIRIRKGLAPIEDKIESRSEKLEKDINRVAAVVRSSIDIDKIYKVLNIEEYA